MEEELGNANWELQMILSSLLNEESATVVRDGRGGEQQTPFVIYAKSLLAYFGQLEKILIEHINRGSDGIRDEGKSTRVGVPPTFFMLLWMKNLGYPVTIESTTLFSPSS